MLVAAVLLFASLIAVLYFGMIREGGWFADPTPTPTFTPTPTPSSTPTPTPTPTNTPTPTPSPTPTPTPGPTPIPGSPTPTPDDGRKLIAITFDDGPYSELTQKFVDKLVEYNAKATWFVVGNRINDTTGPQLKYAVDHGMEIGIHAWTHSKYYDSISEEEYKEEVNKTYEAILQYTGVAPRLLRAPGGRITKKQIAESPLYVINWNVDSEDWKLKGRSTEAAKKENVDKIVNNVLTHTRKGSIILMHEIYYNSYDAFCRIVDELTKKGFEFVTVSELLGEAPLGKQYYNRP
ncbi:MAG: polysaccharide deacetylase family protein [Lachnospiraceae bacterium]|nr:polysaccharide deacetylase family protein [Lachnospiraceae bacterium]